MSSGIAMVATGVQVIALLAGAPVVVGAMRQVRARLEGRAGAGIMQPWRDLRKQLRKQQLRPDGTTAVFLVAPAVLAGTTLLIAAIAPLISTGSPLDSYGDLFAIVGLLFLGTVALALAGLDTGTAFGGMGASRELTVAALVEPTILLAAIVSATAHHPQQVISPGGLLAFVALVIVILAETGRLPVDNPSTHLELTMLHEAMVLEYAGPRLALVEWASGMRLSVLLALLANLFLPWGIAGTHAGAVDVLVGLGALVVKIALLAVAVAAGEVFAAKLRLFRVPELLAGSFLLALLAVTASSFLAPAAA
jgi:formate hydrogenlyase subunit 4